MIGSAVFRCFGVLGLREVDYRVGVRLMQGLIRPNGILNLRMGVEKGPLGIHFP